MKGLDDIDFREWQPKKILSELNVNGVSDLVVSRFVLENPPTSTGFCLPPPLRLLAFSSPLFPFVTSLSSSSSGSEDKQMISSSCFFLFLDPGGL